MRSILKNNIFTNPQGWAQNWGRRCVGSSIRYRLIQLATVFFAIETFALVVVVCKHAEKEHLCPHDYASVGATLFLTVVLLPLCHLKALRYYVSDSVLHSKPSS